MSVVPAADVVIVKVLVERRSKFGSINIVPAPMSILNIVVAPSVTQSKVLTEHAAVRARSRTCCPPPVEPVVLAWDTAVALVECAVTDQ
jgi:hypothetical protein